MRKVEFKPLELVAQAANPDSFWKGAEFGTRYTMELVIEKISNQIKNNQTPGLGLDTLILADELFSEIKEIFGNEEDPASNNSNTPSRS